MPSYSEVVSLLQGFEQRNSWIEAPNSVSYAFYGQRNQGQQQQNYTSRTNQLYGRQGHIVKICWTLPNNSINNDELPQSLAALTMFTSIPDT